MDDFDITPIGITNHRNERKAFGIRDKDRSGHIYVIGKTGMGKSTLLKQMVTSDIVKGKGLCVIDPHGDVVESLLKVVPKERLHELIYLDPADSQHPITFNPLSGVDRDQHHLVASGLISTFKKIWSESWGPRMEYILRLSLLTLLEYGEATLLDVQPLLTDANFRKGVLMRISSPHLLSFWEKEFEKYPPQFRNEAIAPILNKLGLFTASAPLNRTIGHTKSSFSIEEVMQEGKMLLVNLSKGKIGEDASSLLGSMLVTGFGLGALSRANVLEQERKPFFLYVDEMQSFVSLAFADMLAEARKYGLCLFLAHQYVDQIREPVREAVFGNVGTMITFRVGATDATSYLSKEFYPPFSEQDLISLPKHHLYLKLLIDGTTSFPFSAQTMKVADCD